MCQVLKVTQMRSEKEVSHQSSSRLFMWLTIESYIIGAFICQPTQKLAKQFYFSFVQHFPPSKPFKNINQPLLHPLKLVILVSLSLFRPRLPEIQPLMKIQLCHPLIPLLQLNLQQSNLKFIVTSEQLNNTQGCTPVQL